MFPDINQKRLKKMLDIYLRSKPAFLAIIRVQEAILFNSFLSYRRPVLDFGCGDGFFSHVSLINSSQRIDVGLETNEQRANSARQTGIYKKIQTYDGKIIPFADKTFSIIISNSVLEHIVDIDISLNEIYRVLDTNGKFFVTVMVKRYEKNLLGVSLFGTLYKHWMRKKAYHVHLFSEPEWSKHFQKAGFKIIGKKGYLSRRNTRMLDVLQYLSAPAIVTQRIAPNVSKLYCQVMNLCLRNFLQKRITEDYKENAFSSYLYILTK